MCVLIALFPFLLFLCQKELKFGRDVALLVACSEHWVNFLVVLVGFYPCSFGGHMSRLRHLAWDQCSHGLSKVYIDRWKVVIISALPSGGFWGLKLSWGCSCGASGWQRIVALRKEEEKQREEEEERLRRLRSTPFNQLTPLQRRRAVGLAALPACLFVIGWQEEEAEEEEEKVPEDFLWFLFSLWTTL